MNRLWFIPPIVATFAQLLPIAAVAPQWRRTDLARRWIVVWCCAFFLSDVLQLTSSRLQVSNLWLFKFINPVEDGIILYVLSFWQVRPYTRLAFRVAIPLFILTYLTIAFSAGEEATFQAIAGPFRALVVLSAALFTLISRVASEPEDVMQRDWLWTSVGVSLYYGAQVSVEPIAAAMGTDRSAMLAVFTVKSTLDVVAFILIWRGMRCPLRNGSSGSI